MKTLLTVITTSLLLSTASFAGTMQENHTDLSTATYQSKAEAYDAGFKMIENLKTMSDKELAKTLRFHGNTWVSDIKIKDTQVTVAEFATSPSEFNYKAIVNVDYNFKAEEQDDE